MFEPLFKPLKLGALELPNRVLMAPLTRNRAEPGGTPREMAIDYCVGKPALFNGSGAWRAILALPRTLPAAGGRFRALPPRR